MKCHECEGYDHLQLECPLFKRKEMKCSECKGEEHLKTECRNLQKNGEKSLMCFSDTESENEGDNKDLLLNFMAMMGAQKSSSDIYISDENDGDEIDVKKEYRELYDQCMKLSHENILMIKNTAILKAHVNIMTIDSSNPKDKDIKALESGNVMRSEKDIELELIDEKQTNLVLEDRVAKMWQAFTEEHTKAQGLEHDLTEDHKKIWMLSRETKDLDQILTIGQPPKVKWTSAYNIEC